MAADGKLPDMLTGRPRTPNDQYTVLTDIQLKNLKKDASPFFAKDNVKDGKSKHVTIKPAPIDRFATNRSQFLYRDNPPRSHPHCFIDDQWQRDPPTQHNTCRLGASLRWGPPKTGHRTNTHFHTEEVHRYLNIDMYKRNPTNIPATVVMKYGRPSEGYYQQRNPNFNTWFGSTHQLNETNVLTTIRPKTFAEYGSLKNMEQSYNRHKASKWPEVSEYTDKFLLRSKISSVVDPMAERRNFHREQRRLRSEAALQQQAMGIEQNQARQQAQPVPA